MFWEDVAPEIQQHCLQYGVDTLFFDPFQGLDNEMARDLFQKQPQVFANIIKQIDACRRLADNLYFIVSWIENFENWNLGVDFKVESKINLVFLCSLQCSD